MKKYQVFTRSWWKIETDPHTGIKKRVPHVDERKTILYTDVDLETAQALCNKWNSENKPGPTSRKAEFTSDY
jgi:hypothetical protein